MTDGTFASKGFVALAPIEPWHSEEQTIAPNLCICRIEENGIPITTSWHDFLSNEQIRELRKTRFWIRYSFEDAILPNQNVQNTAIQTVWFVLSALQVLAPVGAVNLVLVCRERDGVLDLHSVTPGSRMRGTSYAKVCGRDASFTTSLPVVFDEMRKAFAGSIIRIMNPVYLLEYGLQANNLHLATLFWTAALDSLCMAISKSDFVERIQHLLGANTLVFPPEAILHRQPRYRVKELVGDLFELRSEIAHGREISQKFLSKAGFPTDTGGDIFPEYQYRQVLHESALFMVTRALRTIFVNGLVQEVGNVSQWRRRLKAPI